MRGTKEVDWDTVPMVIGDDFKELEIEWDPFVEMWSVNPVGSHVKQHVTKATLYNCTFITEGDRYYVRGIIDDYQRLVTVPHPDQQQDITVKCRVSFLLGRPGCRPPEMNPNGEMYPKRMHCGLHDKKNRHWHPIHYPRYRVMSANWVSFGVYGKPVEARGYVLEDLDPMSAWQDNDGVSDLQDHD
jgi:hypothetical protein